MSFRAFPILVLSFSVSLAGCTETPSKPTQSEKKTKTLGTAADNSGKKSRSGTEAEAKAALKKALDSWAFGDSLEKFEKDNPGITFFDGSRVAQKPLGRYQFGTSRIDGKSFDFLVTLVLKEENGDVTRSANYMVVNDGKKWAIIGGVN